METTDWQQIYINAQERHSAEIAAKDKEITRLQHLTYSSKPSDISEQAAFIDDEIGKHMAAIQDGEYDLGVIVEILVDLQNSARRIIQILGLVR